jgi:hypothetical protein
MKTSTLGISAIVALGLFCGCSKREPPVVAPAASTAARAMEPPLPAVKWHVVLEVDRMANTAPLQITQTLRNQRVSLVDIYRQAGVELRIVEGTRQIAWQDTVRLADLHGLMTTNTTATANPDEIKVQMLVVSRDFEEPGTYGVMFDFGKDDANDAPRQGFAVFEGAHTQLAGGVTAEVLLTAAHELSHIFNLHHDDWEGSEYTKDATIEGYSYTDTVRWHLSKASIAHLSGTSCPVALIVPGAGGLPFGTITAQHRDLHQKYPGDPYTIVDPHAAMASRGAIVNSATASRVMLATDTGADVSATSPLKLALAVPKTDYVIGEAITVTTALRNGGTAPASVLPLINPEFRLLSIAIQKPGDSMLRPYFPPVLRDSRGVTRHALAAGEAISGEAKVFFGSDGWTFEKPGEYTIQASYRLGDETRGEFIRSQPLHIVVRDPGTSASSRARTLLSSSTGRLGSAEGLYLYMGGGSARLKGAEDKFRQMLAEVPSAPQAVDARIALANNVITPESGKGKLLPQQLDEITALVNNALRSVRAGIEPTALLKLQADVVKELEQAGRKDAAASTRSELEARLEKQNGLRALDRLEIKERL